jgi:hypothetical protein
MNNQSLDFLEPSKEEMNYFKLLVSQKKKDWPSQVKCQAFLSHLRAENTPRDIRYLFAGLSFLPKREDANDKFNKYLKVFLSEIKVGFSRKKTYKSYRKWALLYPYSVI